MWTAMPRRRGTKGHSDPPALALILICALLLFPVIAAAQDPRIGILGEVGIDQKLGARVPADIVLNDETGEEIRLGDLFRGRPMVLSLVYFECPMLCSMTLNGLTAGMKALKFSAGEDFDVLTVSFDPKERPALAASKKDAYVKQYGRKQAGSGWHFLTGSADELQRLTQAVGYRYRWDDSTGQWAHASAIVVLAPDGRVSQYLYGIEFAPRDLRLSLVRAGESKIGNVVDRVLLYCYEYDPATGKYGFAIMNILRAACLGTVFALAAFVILNRRS